MTEPTEPMTMWIRTEELESYLDDGWELVPYSDSYKPRGRVRVRKMFHWSDPVLIPRVDGSERR